MSTCSHDAVTCINPYELVRKYRCNSCGEVMMCLCEESFAITYLPHQLQFATELDTQKTIPVTLGFQEKICNKCRGIPEESYPKAPTYGRTSKIARYYWREIAFLVIPEFAVWAQNQGFDKWTTALLKHQDIYKDFEHKAIEEIKKVHSTQPKYAYNEESQEHVILENKVEVIRLDAIHEKKENGIVLVDGNGNKLSPEGFVSDHFQRNGYKTLFVESVPFHVLFGIFCWMLIQDTADPDARTVIFTERDGFNAAEKKNNIWTSLPVDFGTSSYSLRRADAIKKHFDMLPSRKSELLQTFDFWIQPSCELRQYLWAHSVEDIARARILIEILPVDVIKRILKYLAGNYWKRYLGWPDLLVYNEAEFFFVEVKSSNDKLSEEQKKWIRNNSAELHLPFKLAKIHKKDS